MLFPHSSSCAQIDSQSQPQRSLHYLSKLLSKSFKLPLIIASGLSFASCSLNNLKSPAETNSLALKENTEAQVGNKTAEKDPCLIYDTELSSFTLPEPTSLWSRIREGFVLPDANNPRIAKPLAWYSKHPKHIDAVAERSKPYLHFIVQQLEERNLPLELALIPMIESGFDPFAYSHATASGLWQVMPKTGRSLGLKQNWWYDGRRDVIASTDAALNYLTKLHKMFNEDWLLTLAAYNGGQGNVRRAIRRNQKKGQSIDFWSLDLPRETERYIPKILALKEIILRPDIYNIALPTIIDAPYFSIASTDGQLDLAQAAKLAQIPVAKIYQLNPGYNRWATSPSGPHHLALPVEKYDTFKQALKALAKDERVTWQRYTIQKGDTLSQIAKSFQVDTDLLKSINNLNSNIITAGKTLLVPHAKNPNALVALNEAKRIQSYGATPHKGSAFIYKVKAGDSLWTIARRFNTSVRKVARWNNLPTRKLLRVGQKLKIYGSSGNSLANNRLTEIPPGSHQSARKIHYTIKTGDSLSRIASQFGVSVREIENWNSINRKDILRPGGKLRIHVSGKSVKS